MIAYNEEKCLSDILSDILAQTYPKSDTELVITDNASTDSTYDMLCAFRDEHLSEYRDIKIIKNDSRIIPHGLNKCLENASGDILLRTDAHASISPDFIEENVACLEGRYTGTVEYACGGVRPTYSAEGDGMGRMLLSAEESRFGASAASYRGAPERCYVNTVFQAGYRREVIEAVGSYDERLWRTEDNNYNYRVRKAGYKICFEPRIKSKQQIRSSLSRMLKQKNQNGYWVGYTLGICPGCVSPFHMVPLAFLLANIACAVLALSGHGIFGAVMWALYGICSIAFTVKAIIDAKEPSAHMLLLPLVFFLMHVCYGVGTVAGIAKMIWHKLKRII